MATNLLAASTMTPQGLYNSQIASTSPVTLYTVPASTSVTIKHGVLSNSDTIAVTITLAIVPSGGSFDGTHSIMSAYSIQPGDTVPLTPLLGGACMAPGDTIRAQVSVASVVDLVITGIVST